VRFFVGIVLVCACAMQAQAARHARPKTSTTQDTSPEAQLAQAELAYDDYEYVSASAQLSALLDKQPANAKTRQRARLLLAFSQYFRKDESAAKSALTDLFRENVDYPFERELFHPDLVRFFDTTRNEYVASLNVKPQALVVAPSAEPKQTPESVVTPPLAPAVETLGDRHVWLRIFPIIGHYANYDLVGGSVFLSLEVLLIGMNVGGAVAYQRLAVPGGYDAAFAAQVVQNVGGIAAIALGVICIVDAFVWSPARGRAALQKKLQPVVDLGPLGSFRVALGTR
jgi:hypothetical protein